eukprot:jgi/Chrpa1/22243/Chrysochromulina_OHIO_Genome00005924-RA
MNVVAAGIGGLEGEDGGGEGEGGGGEGEGGGGEGEGGGGHVETVPGPETPSVRVVGQKQTADIGQCATSRVPT